MAITINKKNHLEQKYRLNLTILIISAIITAILFVIFLMKTNVLYLVVSLVFFGVAVYVNKNNTIIGAGLNGEKRASRIYDKLPDSYYIFNDLYIEVDSKVSQVDHVIIGDNGIFIVEAKNLNGRVVGHESAQMLTQHKVGRRGGEYYKEFYNPIKQVSTHVFRLSELLKREKIGKWVQGMVFFTNEECVVFLNSDKVPVFSASTKGDKKIIKYIESYSNIGSKLKTEDKNKIIELLSSIGNKDRKIYK